MAIAILMPSLSPTMTEGNLAKWCKNVGDEIKAGDIIAEVETDKATMEIESIDDGVLEKILFADGSEGISVNSLIAILKNKDDTEKDINELLNKHNANLQENEKGIIHDNSLENSLVDSSSNKNNILNEEGKKVNIIELNEFTSTDIESTNNIKVDDNTAETRVLNNRISVSPLAKRMSIQKNIDLAEIRGSGPKGRIVKNDIINFLSKNKHLNNNFNIFNKENFTKKTSSMRKIIAERLSYSKKEVPHFYLSVDCNVDQLLNNRIIINKDLEDKDRISINDIIIKSLGTALSKVPEANCSWGINEITYFGNVDISVAVAVNGGLLTPVIKNVNHLNLSNISSIMKDYIIRANSGKLLPEEYEGGNFSISNLGMYDIDSFSAIINPPQSGILAIGSIVKKPIVINNEFKIASIMTCKLSGDHRAIDGAVGAKLLKEFKNIIENPIKMLA
jgi:pyruvate dehydrogenase E2 component (dihydrolipoamide acetyltransferase)